MLAGRSLFVRSDEKSALTDWTANASCMNCHVARTVVTALRLTKNRMANSSTPFPIYAEIIQKMPDTTDKNRETPKIVRACPGSRDEDAERTAVLDRSGG
jgi:hypothetical protein